eukprot:SAG31_NODE_159_length_21911_cov_12.220750_9_plen_191_part_00
MQHDQHHQHDDQLVHELGGSSTSSHHLQHSEESASEHKPKNDVRGMTMPIRACRILSTILDSTAIKQLCLSLMLRFRVCFLTGAARCWAFLVQFYHRNLGNVHSLLLLSVMLVYVVPVFIWALLHRLDCVIEPSCEDATALGWRHMFGATWGCPAFSPYASLYASLMDIIILQTQHMDTPSYFFSYGWSL